MKILFSSLRVQLYLLLRVVRHWHTLPREAVDVPSLEVFQVRLNGAWNNLVQWKVSLTMAGGWN